MDVTGAKVLERRLDPTRMSVAAPPSGAVPEGAPPIYQWFGIAEVAVEAAVPVTGDLPTVRRSWLRRFGLSSR